MKKTDAVQLVLGSWRNDTFVLNEHTLLAAHTGCGASYFTKTLFREADGFSVSGGDKNVFRAVGDVSGTGSAHDYDLLSLQEISPLPCMIG